MYLRFRRPALAGLVAVFAVAAAAPAVASADSITVTPANLQAGGNPAITATLTFAPADTPKTVVTELPAGLLANLNANPACLTTTTLTGTTCEIGTGTVTGASPGNTTLFLVPAPSSSDVAGIDTVVPGSSTPLATGIAVRSSDGGATLTTTLPATPQVTGLSFTLDPTLDGQPFTRLPTSCAPVTSTLNVTYYGSTPASSSSSQFTPNGCLSLAYAPTLTAAVTKDAKDSGATVVVTSTQKAGESASKAIELKLPAGIAPNLSAGVACLTATGCKIGTASAASPLIPAAALANGTVTLGGTVSDITLTVSFPAPLPVTVAGTVSLTSGSVTFSPVPDIPLTSLTLTLTSGPNGQKAFITTCASGDLIGTFTPQDGAGAKTVSAPISYANCAAKPTSSGSLAGLAAGKPKLRFKVSAGSNAPSLSSLSVGLPSGLAVSGKAISTSKKCTGKGKKKKCTTTVKIKGLTASGATVAGARVAGGRLVVTFKKPSKSATLALTAPLLTETTALESKVKKGKVKTLTVSVKATDAKHASTALSLKLKV